jgi:8-oxo-dGTP pyrophosphatase MutT (NUDIX family)
MQVVYYGEEAPQSFSKSIFLAGPTSRNKSSVGWRPYALKLLEKLGYDGVVFVPEYRDWPPEEKYDYSYYPTWEWKHLHMADVVVFWVPRDLVNLPGLTTNVEFGFYMNHSNIVYGRPKNARKVKYLDWLIFKNKGIYPHADLEETLSQAASLVAEPHERSGGARLIPMYVWKTPQFQSWYKTQYKAGNRLDGAELRYVKTSRKNPQSVFLYVLWVNVWIPSEKRHKSNEFIIGRPDISTICAYFPDKEIIRTKIVLVKEFRSPASTQDCFIRELPGGSSFKNNEGPLAVASSEFEEETGIRIDPKRFDYIESRQVVGTLSTHKAHLFMVELTAKEIKEAESLSKSGQAFGVESDSEKTYVRVYTLGDLFKLDIDWATMGMVMRTINQAYAPTLSRKQSKKRLGS